MRVLNLVNEVVKTLDGATSLEFVKYGGMGMPADFDARMRDHYRNIMQRSSMKGKLGIRADVDEEVLTLSKVTVDSAASESGLMIGDVLLQVNGRDITSMETLRRALAGGLRGEEVSMIVTRDGVKKTFKATLK